jgi:hypothetical protein
VVLFRKRKMWPVPAVATSIAGLGAVVDLVFLALALSHCLPRQHSPCTLLPTKRPFPCGEFAGLEIMFDAALLRR